MINFDLLYIIVIFNFIYVFNYFYNIISKMYWVKYIYRINYIVVYVVEKKIGYIKINRFL